MHLSDGFLDPSTAILTSAAAAGALGMSVWQLRRNGLRIDSAGLRPSASAGKMALVAAGVFAIQAVNFPLTSGVSGHLLGGVAAAALLGPWAGMVVVAAVLAVQCCLLGDGGISALGANVLNMAVLGAVLGGPVHALSRRGTSATRRTLTVALASAAALPLGAIACAAEMHLAGRASFTTTAGEMLPLHLLLAVAEAAFTAAAVLAVQRSATWIRDEQPASKFTAVVLIATLVATAALVPYSSTPPDTLEAAVDVAGLAASEPLLAAAVGDGAFAAAGEWGTAVLPILLGATLAFAAAWIVGRSLSNLGRPTS